MTDITQKMIYLLFANFSRKIIRLESGCCPTKRRIINTMYIPYAPLPLCGKLILYIQKVSQTGAKEEHKKN
jgi:hypothetical protein